MEREEREGGRGREVGRRGREGERGRKEPREGEEGTKGRGGRERGRGSVEGREEGKVGGREREIKYFLPGLVPPHTLTVSSSPEPICV